MRVACLWLLQVGETWGPDAEDHSKPPKFASGWGTGSGAHNPFSHKGKGGLGERGKLQTSTLGLCASLAMHSTVPHPNAVYCTLLPSPPLPWFAHLLGLRSSPERRGPGQRADSGGA